MSPTNECDVIRHLDLLLLAYFFWLNETSAYVDVALEFLETSSRLSQ